MSTLLDDKNQNYKDLFITGIENINQIISNTSFKKIHSEAKKIISILTGQEIEKEVVSKNSKGPSSGTKTTSLLEDLEDIGKEDNKQIETKVPENTKTSLEDLNFSEAPKDDNDIFKNMVVKPNDNKAQSTSGPSKSLLDFPNNPPIIPQNYGITIDQLTQSNLKMGSNMAFGTGHKKSNDPFGFIEDELNI